MDAVDVIATTTNMMSLENGSHRKLPSVGHANLMLHEGRGSHANEIRDSASDNISVDANHMEESGAVKFSSKCETVTLEESKELGEKNPNQEDISKPVKVQGKTKRASSAPENPTNSKPEAEARLRKNVAANREMVTSFSNGLTSRPKQPLANTSNGRRSVEGHASVDAGISEKSEKVRASLSTTDIAVPEVSKEQRKMLKPSKENSLDKADEEHPESPLSAKPRRLGTTPAYSFSFKCNERAEKRKEFFSKIEEKIHAKEVEISNLEAKTKETQEAEIKQLRKKLTFKATPMPSFYQEPTPPKMELKKIPTTRAKSPKFGRQKSSSEKEKAADTERNQSHVIRPTRLSLDDRTSRNDLTSDSSLHPKKPQRKSLPIISSHKTETPSPAQELENKKLDLEVTQPTQPEIEPIEQEPASEPTNSEDKDEEPTEEKFG